MRETDRCKQLGKLERLDKKSNKKGTGWKIKELVRVNKKSYVMKERERMVMGVFPWIKDTGGDKWGHVKPLRL